MLALRLYDPLVRRLETTGYVFRDEVQLDGTRYLGIDFAFDGNQATVAIVVDHDGVLTEAEMVLDSGNEEESVLFDTEAGLVNWDDLEFKLFTADLEIEGLGRTDGDLDILVELHGDRE